MSKGGRRGGQQLAHAGAGPLLQRDYWCIIRAPRVGPAELIATLRRHFAAFAPDELVVFFPRDGRSLESGDEIDLRIAGAGPARVRVIHVDRQSFTLGTLAGHPEAGRITFGSYHDDHGELIFHIRSHARSKSRLRRAGFLAAGEVMQTSAWSEFVNRVAVAFGEGPKGFIHAETKRRPDEPEPLERNAPTYHAVD